MSFNKKVVIVTGASSGIGAATAKEFAKEGADVVIVGRNDEKLAKVEAEVTKIGMKPLIIKADISKDAEAQKIIDATITKYGKLDILINNAGLLKTGRLTNGDIMASYDAVMATNVRALVNMTALATPELIKSKGNIVNISSVAGTVTANISGMQMYNMSKAAVNHFSRGAAFELAAHGVRVNIVSPGPTVTDIVQNAGASFNIRDMGCLTPLNRVLEPEEVANVVLFLASEKAKGITGSDYVIDSGAKLGLPIKPKQ